MVTYERVARARAVECKHTALVIEKVQDFLSGLLITGTHKRLPSIAKVHGTKTKRGDTQRSAGREQPVPVQWALGGRCHREDRHIGGRVWWSIWDF